MGEPTTDSETPAKGPEPAEEPKKAESEKTAEEEQSVEEKRPSKPPKPPKPPKPGKSNAFGICQNCGATLKGEYCHVCGQAAKEPRRAVIGLVQDVFVDTLAIDGKLARTLGLLLWKPGALAKRYLDGKRVSYSPPFRLYLFASVFFFFGLFWATAAQVGAFRTTLADTTEALAELPPEERAELEEGLRQAQTEYGVMSPEFAEQLALLDERVAAANEKLDQDAVGLAQDGAGTESGDDIAPEETSSGEETSDAETAGADTAVAETPEEQRQSFEDMVWSDVGYDGPAWGEPYAKRIFEAAQDVRKDPRLFVAEIRQNVPRVLLLAPVVYGVILLLLYVYRRKYYVYDHFVVSLYMHAALYAYLLIALLISVIPGVRDMWFVPLIWGWLQPFLVFRQAYGSNWISAWLKWVLSMSIYVVAFAAIITLGLSYSLYKS